MLLDLGCGKSKRSGAIGVDIIESEVVDVVHDLNEYPYPFADNEFNDILFEESIEHLNDIVKTMEEIYRISASGAKVTIRVPYFRSHYAIDPTHKQLFVSHSFFYFDPTHSFHKKYRYSNAAFFKVDRVIFDEQFKYRSPLRVLLFSIPRWFANNWPMKYEEYLAPYFPLHSLTFYLTAIKD